MINTCSCSLEVRLIASVRAHKQAYSGDNVQKDLLLLLLLLLLSIFFFGMEVRHETIFQISPQILLN